MATHGKPTPEDSGVDEDTIVDELYGLAPDAFVAARDAHAHTARAAGDRALAGRIGDLRRPVLAAWLANLLVREHRDEIDAFLRLGTAMRDAQERLRGPELRELSRRRNRVIDALRHQALALAAAHGHPTVGDTTLRDLQDTLNAALADPDAAQRLAAGRLTAPLRPEDAFASAPTGRTTEQGRATPPAGAGKAAKAGKGTRGAEALKGNDAAEERAARERARKQYESELAHARATVEAAEKSARGTARTARERRSAAESARARHTEAVADAESLATRLETARTRATRLGTAADKAEAERERADRAARDASAAARSARDDLDHVTATRPD
ncbi:hypothetical protein [Embleya hyalina]|uniref:Uncharacterized protein n=1 Tax=Embleya hyalina TaxID=516124 RepID=A0A401YM43_9ACTN|nr:hypothetical protein [Embleya hyalina]GCD95676.1 hypothetical protein EHYA_03351 [Embleya hyalina]